MLFEYLPPTTVGIEFTNVCQLRCPYCDAQHLALRRPPGMMSEETFDNVLRQLPELGARNIRVIGAGEVTLHPKFAEWIIRLRPFGCWTSATTNGQRLTEEVCHAMLVGLDAVEVSVDSDNAAGYERSRVGGQFDALISGLKRLRAMRAQLRSKTLIHVRVMLRPSEEPARLRMLHYWSQFADTLSTQGLQDYFHDGYDLYPVSDSVRIPPCVTPFKLVGVNWNGDVPLCDAAAFQIHDARGVLLGNVNTETLASMWRGPVISQYRRGHRENVPDLIPMCRGCHYALSPRMWGKVFDHVVRRPEPEPGEPSHIVN